MFSAMLSLPCSTLPPPASGNAITPRIVSPSTGSTLITRAPRSASTVAPNGAANMPPSSSTVTPASGQAPGACPVLPPPVPPARVRGRGWSGEAASRRISPACSSSRGARRISVSGRRQACTRVDGWRTGPRSGSSTVTTRPSWTSCGCASASSGVRNCSPNTFGLRSKTASHSASVRSPTLASIFSHHSWRSSGAGRSGNSAHFGSVTSSASPSSSSQACMRRGAVWANCSQVPSLVAATSSAYISRDCGLPRSSNAAASGLNASG